MNNKKTFLKGIRKYDMHKSMHLLIDLLTYFLTIIIYAKKTPQILDRERQDIWSRLS